jgi:hypothetical protein
MGFNRGIGWFGTQHISSFIITLFDINSELYQPVEDHYDVSQWNTFFGLPANGDPFKSVSISGNVVSLYDSKNINITGLGLAFSLCFESLFISRACAVTLGDYCFSDSSATLFNIEKIVSMGNGVFSQDVGGLFPNVSFILKGVTSIPANTFIAQFNMVSLNIPDITNLGGTTGDDGLFSTITGKDITITVKSSLMTCNGGNPDGDIQNLQSNNNVTIITVP